MTVHSLTLTARQVRHLRDHLIRDDGLERVAYLYCSHSGDNRLLVEEVVPVADDDMQAQSAGRCRPRLEVERDLITDCGRKAMHPVIAHSHPFAAVPSFSAMDDDMMDGLTRTVDGLYDDTELGFTVIGTDGINTVIYNPAEDRFDDLPVNVVGNHTLDTPVTTPNGMPPADAIVNGDTDIDLDTDRYDRNIRALGEHGQHQLAATHIAVVGVGGLGSIMAEMFARYGVQQLTVIDPDIVEESNLPRLFGASDDHVDEPKVAAVEEHLRRCNPDIDVATVQKPVEYAVDALKEVDLIVAGVDQVSPRLWLNQFAVRHLIPYIDSGVVIDTDDDQHVESMEGFIHRVLPGATACFDCLDRGDREAAYVEHLSDAEREEAVDRGYIDETDLSPEPAVVPLNGMIASKTVKMVAKYVTGYARPADFLRFEDIDNKLTALTTTPNDECVTCGDNGMLGQGDRVPTDDDVDAFDADIDLDIAGDPGSVDEHTQQDADT